MRSEPMRDPRRAGKHVGAALDYLASLGIGDVQVVKAKHLRVSWPWGARRLVVSLACTPRDEDVAALRVHQAINRAIRAAVSDTGRRRV